MFGWQLHIDQNCLSVAKDEIKFHILIASMQEKLNYYCYQD